MEHMAYMEENENGCIILVYNSEERQMPSGFVAM